MTQKDDEFADFDAHDEFDDAWDEETLDEAEDFGETELAAAGDFSDSPKKKSIVKPALLLLLLCGVGGGGYYYFTSSAGKNLTNSLPVIEFDTDTLAEAPQNTDVPTEAPVAEADFDIDIAGEVPTEPQAPVTEQSEVATGEDEVLTPLPENIDAANVDLPDLFAETDNAEQDAPLQNETEQDELTIELEEDELFTKTESEPVGLEEDEIAQSSQTQPIETAEPEATQEPEDELFVLPEETVDTPPEDFEVIEEQPSSAFEDDLMGDVQQIEEETVEDETEVEAEEPTPQVENVEPVQVEEAKPEPTLEVSPPVEKKQPAVAAKKVVQPKPEWVMRSAQPGRAVLHDRKTGETKTVEVNNIINGLGRIKSIQKVNGKWVVKGTLGSVYQ